jgi:hypothetical protein
LAKVNFDVIVSSITSIEGYNYAALFVDDCTGFQWLYGMKTRDEVVDVAKRWMAEIGDLCEKYPLRVVMRNNAGATNRKPCRNISRRWVLRTTIQQRMNHGRMAWLKQRSNQRLRLPLAVWRNPAWWGNYLP